MKQLLVVAHDPSPNTRRLVESVLEGAGGDVFDDVSVRHVRPLEAGAEDVLNADAVIFGTTENLGYMSGALKDFFDRSFYSLLDRSDAMPYGILIRAGKDGTGARRAIESIVGGLNWKPVQAPLICRGKWRDEFLEQARELGTTMAAGLDAGIF